MLKEDFGFYLFNHVKNKFDSKKLKIWKKAFGFVVGQEGLVFDGNSDDEFTFIVKIVFHVHNELRLLFLWDVKKEDDYDLLSETNSDATSKFQNNKFELVKQENVIESSTMITYTKHGREHKVFVQFNMAGIDHYFIHKLMKFLKHYGVNAYKEEEDKNMRLKNFFSISKKKKNFFKSIKEPRIALIFLSSRTPQSIGCLYDLVKINELIEEGKLLVVPIFHMVTPLQVQELPERFGDDYRFIKWDKALKSIAAMPGFMFDNNSDETKFFTSIATHVKNLTIKISLEQIKKPQDPRHGDVFMDYVRSQDLKEVDGERDGIFWDTKSDRNTEETEIVQAEKKSRRYDSLNLREDEKSLGDSNSDATFTLQNCDENIVEPVIEENKHENISASSTMVTHNKPEDKVYINFQGSDMRHGFVSQLLKVLTREGVNVYSDIDELPRGDLTELHFKGIKESSIGLVIFSIKYTESRWCLNELLKIKELMEEGKLLVIPIFYKVLPLGVTQLKGEFGVNFWNLWRIHRDHHIIKWKEALEFVASMKGIISNEHSSESEFITATVNEVLKRISWREREIAEVPIGNRGKHETYLNKHHLFGVEQRMEQLEKKLEFHCNETRIIGVVGMPGIGKTTLAMMLHKKWNCKFIRCVPFLNIRKNSHDYGLVWLRKTLIEVLLEGSFPMITDETTHESVKDELLQTKILVVLDDVSDKKQIEFLLGDLDWIKKGSKIVITTCDKSLLEGFADDTYLVPKLNDVEAFKLFTYHAFNDQTCSPDPTSTFMMLSRMFVDYARGHPSILSLLGRKLRGRDESQWEYNLEVTKESNMMLQDVWKISIEQLNERQREVFLDIACFFKSKDEYFVKSLLDSGDPDSIDTVSEVRDLSNKFLISISPNDRVEMNDLLHTFDKDLTSPRWLRLWNYEDIINELKTMEKSDSINVRGLFLDMSKLIKIIYLNRSTFINMRNLRYLKIYDSSCSRQCKTDCKLNLSNELEFPLEEVRYFHWMKFPLEELPLDFRPENIVDLRLPYSKIKRIWEGVKDTPRLKWVDLRHSSKLQDLSAMSKAENLQRLNLEGCTSLDQLPVELQNMKSLVFLNLRGCVSLWSLPKMNLISLKTLILSDCSSLKEFQLISESVKFLHLDGTSIKCIPPAIQKLQRLVVLNLKNCKMLEHLPNCLGELQALEELILSGCSRIEDLSHVRECLKHLQSLLLDQIGAKYLLNIMCIIKSEDQASADKFREPTGPSKWPLNLSGVSSLQRLSLSGNDFISFHIDIWQLYNLRWLDVTQCKKLRSIPMLPPRLQYFNAHGCDSLEIVANTLAFPMISEQIHATFNFSNCNNLDQNAKDSIISYTQWRSQLVLDELSRYNGGFVLEVLIGACFPGWEIPAWFSHQASGSVLEPKLPPHWCDDRFIGIALCGVILFPSHHEQRNHLLVTCNCVFSNEEGSCIRFRRTIGSWRKPSYTSKKIEQSHVFIGYTSMLDIKNHGEVEGGGRCSHTDASFEFQVTDGIEVIEDCEVLKCGFSLVYATNERGNISWDAKTVVFPERIDENISGKEKFYGDFKSHDESSAREDTVARSYHDTNIFGILENLEIDSLVGIASRLKQMEKMLYYTPRETRIVGVVGMHGIGKTTLAKILFQKRGSKFPSHLFLTVSECKLEHLRMVFLNKLLKHVNQDEINLESMKNTLLQKKVFVVLDDVSDKKQLEFLLGDLKWIKKGSKIVITTCDKSLLEGFAHDTYVVPQLNNKEAFQLLSYYALPYNLFSSETRLPLLRMFVENVGGNPLALKSLGYILCGKDETYWKHELQRVRQSFDMKMRDVWRFSFDQLNERQKDVFLDIMYFYKSEDEYFVRSVLDSGNPQAVSEVKELEDMFLITISGGRVEMHDQLCTLGEDLSSAGRYKLCDYKNIVDKLTKMKQQEANNVRGIFIDMFNVSENIALESKTFTHMHNILYLKIYDSCCHQHCKAESNLYFPDGLEFPLEKVRYLHWVKFPFEELPSDFRPANLVDLRLPYSKIKRVWEGIKDTPLLKWVDLRHSSNLLDLSALSKAEILQRLNLEGCTSLDKLPLEIQNMKSLILLNLRGCIRLCSLPKINLAALKTLILSDCSSLKEFQIISENMEFLHLDGTSIKTLPPGIENLQRLVVLNLKNCKMLECLPNCLGKLKFLDELILSGCSRFQTLPNIRYSLNHLRILLYDGTRAKEMPNISCFTGYRGETSTDMLLQPSGSYSNVGKWPCGVHEASSLQRLCLSGSDFVSLQPDIGQLYNLKWLDVKHCKKLRFVPTLPPRLQFFDAHGCDSLERVANPLAAHVSSEQIHATFNFSNCNNLDQEAKDSIISYTQSRSQLVIYELTRYNEGLVLEDMIGTCFPGWEVPAWFSHRTSGSVLKPKLPPHWSDNMFTGISLCVVIQFPSYHEQRNCLLVKCNCELKDEDGLSIRFSCIVGGWSESSSSPRKLESSHVFIGHTSNLHINKHGVENKEGCIFSEVSLEFQVTDGSEEINSYKVLKCGFSLVYASNETKNER